MKAIIFDKSNKRSEVEIESATETISNIVTDGAFAFKITYKLDMYDTKKRPIYIENQREQVKVTMEEN